MDGVLRQSTAVDILLGPHVDSGDGDTAETTLTIEDSDVRLSKNGQNMGAKSDVTTCVHDEEGMYNCEFDATDTDTIGILTVLTHMTGALVVKQTYQVMDGTSFDALFGVSATLLTSQDIGQLYESDVATATSDTELIMTVNIVNDDNWIGQIATIEDITTGDIWVTWISDVQQATETLFFEAAPNGTDTIPFTVAVGDIVRIESRVHPLFALQSYDPPTRAEATTDKNTIVADIRGFARLLGRSDAAIATDQSVELAAMNANDGAGAGNYDNTTDSVEAQADVSTEVRLAELGSANLPADIDTLLARCTAARLAELDQANIPADAAGANSKAANIQSRIPAVLVNDSMKSNIARVNNVAVTGTGAVGDEWGPV
jgi:hypothetical protein